MSLHGLIGLVVVGYGLIVGVIDGGVVSPVGLAGLCISRRE